MTLETLTQGEPAACDPGQIEARLSTLWRSAAAGAGSERALTRACALTLLIYVESEAAAKEVTALINRVGTQNPSRSVVMVVDRRAPVPGLTASVSGSCHFPTAGRRQICSEEISLVARGDAVRALPSAVVPLLKAGLPVYLWWRAGRFVPPPEFNVILRITDRVVVDSERFADPVTDLASLAATIRAAAGHIGFSDLNWLRITPWRDLVAQCFDSAEPRSALPRLREVRIECEADRGIHSAQALLLAGWLAGRLGWRFAPDTVSGSRDLSGTLLTCRFESASGSVSVSLAGRAKSERNGTGLVSLILVGGEPGGTFSFLRDRDKNSMRASTELPGRARIERYARVPIPDEVSLLNEDLKVGRRDRLYEEALRVVAQMAPALACLPQSDSV
ncbi:MAG TPA: glucose-6-phosphate dehydrogenase assembly protein OpcA [Terriglobia bacterium]|nr:glucose-6-phosphate dehydrogenase assembly protein OpcA [Terriglobia bacterium]